MVETGCLRMTGTGRRNWVKTRERVNRLEKELDEGTEEKLCGLEEEEEW